MLNIGNKIKDLRKAKKMTQDELAALINITKHSVMAYETEKRLIPIDTLYSISKVFKVPIEYFFSDTDFSQRGLETKMVRIPILSNVSAGVGVFGEETPIDWLELPEAIAKKSDYASFVSGDSMEPKIFEGDLLLIEKIDILENGDIGVFKIGEDIVCKKFKSNPITKEIILASLNPKYKSILIDNSYCENNEFNILGKVVGKLDYDF
ncbi:MAG: LexA family protein [Cetobacterium sp.]|uniref:LexA family protein n=1 Tax=Cetobacterium sp. TaxID=2071632 RepID=UPI003F2BC5FC